ncbi:unnamed protein product [Colias eurytheme]|nr:unnamed protein product [Colias eurytheme]
MRRVNVGAPARACSRLALVSLHCVCPRRARSALYVAPPPRRFTVALASPRTSRATRVTILELIKHTKSYTF